MFQDIALKLFKSIETATKQSQNEEQAYKGLHKALVHFHGSIPRTTDIEKNMTTWLLKVQVGDSYFYSNDYLVSTTSSFATTPDRTWKNVVPKADFILIAKSVTPIELILKVGDAEYRYDIFDMKVLDEQ